MSAAEEFDSRRRVEDRDRSGPVDIDTPRDRDGSFGPAIIKKRQRRLHGVDSMVISLTAKGWGPEIEATLAETYGTEILRETISRITGAGLEDISLWQIRPLDRVSPAVFKSPPESIAATWPMAITQTCGS